MGIRGCLGGGAVLLGLAVLLLGVGVEARELVRETFESAPEGGKAHVSSGRAAGTRGWGYGDNAFVATGPVYVERAVSFDNGVVRGAISFDLQRKAGAPGGDRKTVFSLVRRADEEYSPLFFQVRWESGFDPARPMFSFGGDFLWGEGLELWSYWILGDRPVEPGQWIHVDLVWDDSSGRYDLYIDGRKQDAKPKYYDDATRQILADPRHAVNAANARKGFPPHHTSRPFGDLLRTVTRVRLGIHSVSPGKEKGYNPLSNAVLSNFAIHVDEIPPVAGGVRIASVTDDSFKVPGISGKLVAGDRVNVTLVAEPGGKASFDMGKAKGLPLEEVPPRAAAPNSPAIDNGTYQGSYAIRPGDDWETGQIVGRFVSSDNVSSEPVVSASKWTIDTKPVVAFSIEKKDLPADSKATSRIKLVARDANGNPVKGRRLKLTLATTDEYTGTVGAGDFGKEVGATVETRWRGETDAWGEVEFDYTAGFAAKTVILSAKDLDSGGVSVDYLTAFKEASIDIALTAPISRAAARRGVQYILKVEASRTELTADGRSRSVIRATLSDPNGAPVAGDPVTFTLSSPNGTLRTIEGKTNASGVATAEYVAGKKIGIVVVTATATLRNASGNVSIILLSDAPAKIHLKAKPETLPADGISRADLSVKVTDINDNPNKDTKVEFKVARGGGKVEYPDRVTDRFGDTANRYTAGTTPGIATVLATVRSKVPTEAELSKARNVLFVPYSAEGDQIRVEKWLKKKGDAVLRGEPVVEYTVGRDQTIRTIVAPFDGTMGEIFVEYWDDAEVGQTLAEFTPAAK